MSVDSWTPDQVERYLEILEAFLDLGKLALLAAVVLWSLEILLAVMRAPRPRHNHHPRQATAPELLAGLGDPYGIRHNPNRTTRNHDHH